MRLASVVIFNLFCFVSAAVYNVTVGKDDRLVYDPSSLTGVTAGDVIHFHFASRTPHSITESTFAQPCVTKSQGRDSGVLTSYSSTPQYSITIDNITTPLWFYCVVGTHCSGGGMVFAINPTTELSYDAFKAKATGNATKPSGSYPSSAEEKGPISKLAAALTGAVFLIGLAL